MKMYLTIKWYGLFFGMFLSLCVVLPIFAAEPSLTATEIVAQCQKKPDVQDSTGELRYTLEPINTRVTKDRTFLYLWKDYENQGDLWSKLILFVLKPPIYKDYGYLRWEYKIESEKVPEQWIYVHKVRNVMRLSKRDSNDLAWGAIGDDLQVQQFSKGTHRLLRTEEQDGITVYWIETLPQTSDSFYSKLVTRFKKSDSWASCRHWQTEFYGKSGQREKEVISTWEQSGKFWYRDKVVVNSEKSLATATYVFSNVKFNVGLSDDDFTTRRLPQAMRYGRK